MQTKKIQNNVNGNTVGYYASKLFQTNELSNAMKGTINISTRNGVSCLIVDNLECTPDKPILSLHGYIGNDKYFYDTDITGLYINKSMLYSAKDKIGHCIFTFFS